MTEFGRGRSLHYTVRPTLVEDHYLKVGLLSTERPMCLSCGVVRPGPRPLSTTVPTCLEVPREYSGGLVRGPSDNQRSVEATPDTGQSSFRSSLLGPLSSFGDGLRSNHPGNRGCLPRGVGVGQVLIRSQHPTKGGSPGTLVPVLVLPSIRVRGTTGLLLCIL